METEEILYEALDSEDFVLRLIVRLNLEAAATNKFIELCAESCNIQVLYEAVKRGLSLNPLTLGDLSHELYRCDKEFFSKTLEVSELDPQALALAYKRCADSLEKSNIRHHELLDILKIYLKAGADLDEIECHQLMKALVADPQSRDFAISRAREFLGEKKRSKLRSL